MQLVIKFSGLEEESRPATPSRSVAVEGTPGSEASAPWAALVPDVAEDADAALGRRILEEFEAQFARGEIRLPDAGALDGEATKRWTARLGSAAPPA